MVNAFGRRLRGSVESGVAESGGVVIVLSLAYYLRIGIELIVCYLSVH